MLTFPTTVSPGDSRSLAGANFASEGQRYDFTADSTFTGTAVVSVTDRVEYLTGRSFTVVRDTTPPVISFTLPAQAPLHFTVPYSATDSESGVRNYEVQYSLNGASWTGWLTGTTEVIVNGELPIVNCE